MKAATRKTATKKTTKRTPAKKRPAAITLPSLAKGEVYAGIVLKDGKPAHHLILLPGELESGTWRDAKAWAKKQGGELPTRQEQALLFANAKDQFQPRWYWSCEQFSSYDAWGQYFSNGYQGYWFKDGSNRARAVRRSAIQ